MVVSFPVMFSGGILLIPFNFQPAGQCAILSVRACGLHQGPVKLPFS